MDSTASCRVCFANNVEMYKLTNTPLQEIYERLANVKLTSFLKRGEPACVLCFLCYAQLRRCFSFQQAAARAEDLLAQLYLERVAVTREVLSMIEHPPVHNYVTTPVENVSMNNTDAGVESCAEERSVKKEAEIERDADSQGDDVNEETEDAQVKLKRECESEQAESPESSECDFDEDVPLQLLRTPAKRRRVEEREVTNIKFNGSMPKIDAREVILTYEQQREAMSARAASLNYLNSPHRCTLCYRGYINMAAYTNHMEKHAERSGEHACPLCFMRYRSARLLRAHEHASHSRQYVCNKCGHTANTRHQASDHERTHSRQFYECRLCGKYFRARTSYLTHVRAAHPGVAAHACTACGEQFVSQHGLRMHAARAHLAGTSVEEASAPEARYCGACDVQFLSRRAWAAHTLATPAHRLAAAASKECPICEKEISSPMSSHLMKHEADLKQGRAKPPAPPGDKLNCDQCALSFAGRARLAAHVRRVHLGLKYDKNLVCELCGKKCTSGATLRYHQRTHTGERPHTCTAPSCGKRFADTNQLRIHTRTHTGERPYSCEHCGRRFAQKPALNRHYRVHTGAKPYSCELCSKSFSQSNSLHTHVKAVHLKMTSSKKRQRANLRKNKPPDLTVDVKGDLGD